jgi:hypothetical protein
MARSMLLLSAVCGLATAFQVTPATVGSSAAARPFAMAPRVAASSVMMAEDPSDKAVAIGAAAVGGVIGVYLFHELSTALVLAIALAYGTTVTNGFGDFSRKSGDLASKAYDKTLEINEQYDVLDKAKGVADTVCTAAVNLDKNYGVSEGIDDKLKLSEATEKLGDKINDLKDSVSGKVDTLKSKASSS